jgi:chloramphenicol-sensitive protein RarD
MGMSESRKGVLAMVLACIIWGLSSLFYAQLRHVPPMEVLCYRSLSSLAFFVGALLLQGRLQMVLEALRDRRRFMTVFAAALLISGNWFGFIFAVSYGYALEASLGYFIFPLVAVLMGRMVFGETLLGLQWVAVGLAALGVSILTIGLGAAPWIALWLAATFGSYGVIKKRLDLGPVVSVTAEVLLLAPLTLAWIVFMGTGAMGSDWWTSSLLILSGPITALPLILFAYAARRAKLSTVGLVQYLNPTIQFVVAALILAEPVTQWHAVSFPVIWVALALYSLAALRQERASRSVVSNAATSGTVEM